ncbi:MAG: primosomal protein N' [Candidatus Latescibacterota bacterium]|nr:primosomal protein N' [Candidatus Latescibacterota bacterium]
MTHRRYVRVALPPPLARELTYGVPAELVDLVDSGSVVLVPVQRRLVTGFVVGEEVAGGTGSVGGVDTATVRDLVQLLDSDTPLNPDVVELCTWMAHYYLVPLGSALAAALPPRIQVSSRRIVVPVEGAAPPDTSAGSADSRVWDELTAAAGPLRVTTLRRRVHDVAIEPTLRRLQQSGRVVVRLEVSGGGISVRHRQVVQPTAGALDQIEQLRHKAPRQALCLERIVDAGPLPKRQIVDEGFGYGILKNLTSRGFIETVDEEVHRNPLSHLVSDAEDRLDLTDDQQAAVESIIAAVKSVGFDAILLHGVTGSGKTLVYIRACEETLAQGRGVLILVPEIALAWQMVRRLHTHFGDSVAVLHSQLSDGERYDTWRRIRDGQQPVVIGARSAVFAPISRLGLVIVDEEHDGSYFQDDIDAKQPMAYSGRDLAVVRARFARVPVVMGSATPSLESFTNAREGKYRLLSLPRRVDDRPLPQVQVVDMRREPFQKKERALFSRSLRLKIRDRLDKEEQIVLLQNRRGFAPVVQCRTCGETVECRSCRVTLTCHQGRSAQLRCHYCDYRSPLPEVCPHCGSDQVQLQGAGTQKVETALEEQFPGARAIRMDVDTTGWKGAHDELVESFRRREADVLIGTQMVAKGLDFPEVTLVGVISADTGLHMPDFRATERTFQLLTQVAGRSGRGKNPGEVVVQTWLPEEPVLLTSAAQNYPGFAEQELAERRLAGFPPFGRMIVMRWRGKEEAAVQRTAIEGTEQVRRTRKPSVRILGPAPAPLSMLRGRYRWQALLMGPSASALRHSASRALPPLRKAASRFGVDLAVVIDPQNTM